MNSPPLGRNCLFIDGEVVVKFFSIQMRHILYFNFIMIDVIENNNKQRLIYYFFDLDSFLSNALLPSRSRAVLMI
jgi:hypothetical protein